MERDSDADPEVQITAEMVERGVRAYLHHASHDEMSFSTPSEVVEAVLLAALVMKPTTQGENPTPRGPGTPVQGS